MKIATFTTPSGFRQWGVIDDESQTILGSADLEEAYFSSYRKRLKSSSA